MAEWQDTSSFSRGATDRTPKEWTCRIGDEKVCVHRLHDEPGRWFLSCWFAEHRYLDSLDAGQARKEAARVVMKWLAMAVTDCKSLKGKKSAPPTESTR